MSQELEIEFKNLLSISEYNQFINYFNLEEKLPTKQKNIYFDTVCHELTNRVYALRARIKTDAIELTLKIPQTKGILEITDIISQAELGKLLNSNILPNGFVKSKLEEVKITSPLIHLATLVTYRREYKFDQFIIALDKSVYYDCTDYEIEVECENYQDGLNYFNQLLKQFSIPKRRTKPKILRAFEYKKRHKKNRIT